MKARESVRVAQALDRASYCVADGMPLVWWQWLANRPAERIYGPDLLLQLAGTRTTPPLAHYLWGSTPDVTSRLAATLQTRFPQMHISGWHAPPYEPVEALPRPRTIRLLQAQPIDILWVGLGSPRQDVWMSMYRPYLPGSVMIGVGAAFDFLSGTRAQAPRWMQQHGLEWFFRLMTEPRRLWRRYLLYNPLFVGAVLRHIGARSAEQVLQRCRGTEEAHPDAESDV
jgi:N-acetylglucosaminyldiphosphoundecaprenol N-acetyl-beta-D-mannosaminyltransferase